MNEELGIVNETRMYYGGNIYTRSRPAAGLVRLGIVLKSGTLECKARAITIRAPEGEIILEKGND